MLFLGDMFSMQKTSGKPSFTWGTNELNGILMVYIHTYLNKLCSQVKGRDIIFHLKKKKKERKTDTAEEVLFAFNGPLSRIPFVAKDFEAKPLLKSDTNFEDKNRTL